MSVNLITVREGRKVALPVTTEAEYRRLRNTSAQMANLRQARQGNKAAKRRLIQFNYSGYYPDGVVKGNKLPSQAFGFDVDEPEEFQRIARLLLLQPASEKKLPGNVQTFAEQPGNVQTFAEQQGNVQTFAEQQGKSQTMAGQPGNVQTTAGLQGNAQNFAEQPMKASPLAEQLGLLMLERSASQGGHAVFLRKKGDTILENQVRVAQALDCELDTNAHDVNRVYFSSTSVPEELLFLSPRLFEDQYGVSPGADEQSVRDEAVLLEQRERMGLEILPEGAHKANKHFRPASSSAERSSFLSASSSAEQSSFLSASSSAEQVASGYASTRNENSRTIENEKVAYNEKNIDNEKTSQFNPSTDSTLLHADSTLSHADSALSHADSTTSHADAHGQLPGVGGDTLHPLPDAVLPAPAGGGGALHRPDGCSPRAAAPAAELDSSSSQASLNAAPRNASAPQNAAPQNAAPQNAAPQNASAAQSAPSYLGIPYGEIIRRWWMMYNDGQTPVKSNRDVLTFELAVNLRHICGFDRDLMDRVIPCYDGFPESQKLKCIDSALQEKRTQMPRRLRDVLAAIRQETLASANGFAGFGGNGFGGNGFGGNGFGGNGGASDANAVVDALDEAMLQDEQWYARQLPRLPQGVADSVEAAGKSLCMPTLVAIAPAIGALATGVKLDVHGTPRGLNLISYICGEFGSGKGQMDPIIAAWMSELQAQADIYTQQEEEWAQKTRRMKSGKAPEQPKLPVRMLPLNNTLANLAERLGNAEGKHSFSFTPEADTVALKWKSAISDFSVMLRQAYDESRYDREAKSADAVRVHIKQLLWNVTMCGTQDALYRVITNYTDGLLSRIAIARTPDNTFSPLAERPATMSDYQEERIKQVAHLLPLMEGTVVLDKLEQQGRMWLERVRLEAMKNDDRVMARQRLRGCVNAQRITCALWLPKVAELLIRKHGMAGAENRLKADPQLWAEMLRKMQGEEMMQLFDILADYLIDNDLYYFREKIEHAYESKNYTTTSSPGMRLKHGRNDTIFARLGDSFSFEQAFQQAMAVKGTNVSHNSVKMMLRNWRKQGLVVLTDKQDFLKQQGGVVVV